jgi:hypothetical protein
MLFSRFIKSAAALALLTIGFAAPVHAQSNKQIISGTWYEDRAAATTNSGTINLTFTQTPVSQFLNLTNVSCHLIVGSNQVLGDMVLNAGTTSGAQDLARPYFVDGGVHTETNGASKFYTIITNQIYFKFGPGRFPIIEIDTAATAGAQSINAQCTIVGNLSDS